MFLKNLRESKKIKAIDVYRKLRIDKSTFNNLEAGKSSLKAEWIPILAKEYGVSQFRIYRGYLEDMDKIIETTDKELMDIMERIEFFLKSNGDNSAKAKGDVQ